MAGGSIAFWAWFWVGGVWLVVVSLFWAWFWVGGVWLVVVSLFWLGFGWGVYGWW